MVAGFFLVTAIAMTCWTRSFAPRIARDGPRLNAGLGTNPESLRRARGRVASCNPNGKHFTGSVERGSCLHSFYWGAPVSEVLDWGATWVRPDGQLVGLGDPIANLNTVGGPWIAADVSVAEFGRTSPPGGQSQRRELIAAARRLGEPSAVRLRLCFTSGPDSQPV
jgi:hypothetical protein